MRRSRRQQGDEPLLKAIGITCGVGSMLLGARNAGFRVEGNVEWRKYYHAEDEAGRNTFTDNFQGAAFPYQREQMTEEEFLRFQNADIALGHPECGNFSQLNANRDAVNDPGDIPLFCDLVSEFRPRFFVMDDLPKSFIAFPMAEYHARLGDYDLFPEWISNWGYGNTQRARNRFFMLGALKQERWAFVPGEKPHAQTVADILADLEGMEGNFPNHDRHVTEENCAKGLHLRYRGHRATWGEMRDYILNDVREGGPIHYVGEDGSEKIRVGSYKGHWEGPAHVLTGGISGFHPRKGLPYTIRERARLQGFPDDFTFHGTVYSDEEGQRRWNHDRNMHMVRQTGKAMPIQFCEYVSSQIMDSIRHGPDHWLGDERATNARVIQPNAYVDEAKRWFCGNVGYANQSLACLACSQARGCDIRERLHIPLSSNQARLVGPAARPRATSNPVVPREMPASPPRGNIPDVENSLRGASRNKNKGLAAPGGVDPVPSSPRGPKVQDAKVVLNTIPTTMLEFD